VRSLAAKEGSSFLPLIVTATPGRNLMSGPALAMGVGVAVGVALSVAAADVADGLGTEGGGGWDAHVFVVGAFAPGQDVSQILQRGLAY